LVRIEKFLFTSRLDTKPNDIERGHLTPPSENNAGVDLFVESVGHGYPLWSTGHYHIRIEAQSDGRPLNRSPGSASRVDQLSAMSMNSLIVRASMV
jgi:hypothetical protein